MNYTQKGMILFQCSLADDAPDFMVRFESQKENIEVPCAALSTKMPPLPRGLREGCFVALNCTVPPTPFEVIPKKNNRGHRLFDDPFEAFIDGLDDVLFRLMRAKSCIESAYATEMLPVGALGQIVGFSSKHEALVKFAQSDKSIKVSCHHLQNVDLHDFLKQRLDENRRVVPLTEKMLGLVGPPEASDTLNSVSFMMRESRRQKRREARNSARAPVYTKCAQRHVCHRSR